MGSTYRTAVFSGCGVIVDGALSVPKTYSEGHEADSYRSRLNGDSKIVDISQHMFHCQ